MELYRHFITLDNVGDKAARLGVYRTCNYEFIVKRLKKQQAPVTKWLFCSKPGYYEHIYRPVGAMLIPLLLDNYRLDDASPPLKKTGLITSENGYARAGYYYNDTKVSYRHPVLIARHFGEHVTDRWFDYLPLLVDWDRSHDIIKTNPYLKNYPQLSKIAWRVICEYQYNQYHGACYQKLFNWFAKSITKSSPSKGW